MFILDFGFCLAWKLGGTGPHPAHPGGGTQAAKGNDAAH